MKKNGVPEDQIIHMAYDDIANHILNPIKGSIFNAPDGENVYDSENIDYRGQDVTKDNFFAVL